MVAHRWHRGVNHTLAIRQSCKWNQRNFLPPPDTFTQLALRMSYLNFNVADCSYFFFFPAWGNHPPFQPVLSMQRWWFSEVVAFLIRTRVIETVAPACPSVIIFTLRANIFSTRPHSSGGKLNLQARRHMGDCLVPLCSGLHRRAEVNYISRAQRSDACRWTDEIIFPDWNCFFFFFLLFGFASNH